MTQTVATIPTDGIPDDSQLRDIETLYELEGWRNVAAVPHAAADSWSVVVVADGRRCGTCGGELIGSELGWGTCGHCGGRSLTPEPPPPVRRLTAREGMVAAVGGWTFGVALGLGLILVAALGAAASWVADWLGGWARLVLAVGAVSAVGGLAWAAADPEVLRP